MFNIQRRATLLVTAVDELFSPTGLSLGPVAHLILARSTAAAIGVIDLLHRGLLRPVPRCRP
jgi:hypothetical protein